MKNLDRDFNFISTMAKAIICVVFVITLAWFGFVGIVGYNTVDTINSTIKTEGGVKQAIEKVWCGEVGCINDKK